MDHGLRAMRMAVGLSPHIPAKCERQHVTHFSGKGYSDSYLCNFCQRTGRFNLNFLGLREVFCNGQKFLKILKPARP